MVTRVEGSVLQLRKIPRHLALLRLEVPWERTIKHMQAQVLHSDQVVFSVKYFTDVRNERYLLPPPTASNSSIHSAIEARTPMMRSSIPALACLVSVISAARFVLLIPNTAVVNPSSLPSTTHATLQSSGPPVDAYITRSNSFNFNNVSVGSYLATIHSRDYAFEPLRIDVTLEKAVEGSGEQRERVQAWQTFFGNEWDNKGEGRGDGGNGLVVEVHPRAPKQYYQERAGCRFIYDLRYSHGKDMH